MPRSHKIIVERSEPEQSMIEYTRQMQIYKSNEMVQRGRMNLSLQEQRCVLFAISYIKPDDSCFREYKIDLNLFYHACGLRKESYTELKKILYNLSNKAWEIPMINDPDTVSYVRWFSTLRTNKKNGIVTIKFHEDMMPYLLNLVKNGEFYTHYELKWVLPMSSQYSIQLYELLKSYQRNNLRWYFEVEELKEKLCCTNYEKFGNLKQRVIDPAVTEINKYGDICVSYRLIKNGRGGRVTHIEFLLQAKNIAELDAAMLAGSKVLDGSIRDWEIEPKD